MSLKEVIIVVVICSTIQSAIGGRKNKQSKDKEKVVQQEEEGSKQQEIEEDVLQDDDEDKVYALAEFHQVGKGVRVELDSLNVSHRATSTEIEAREEGKEEAQNAPVWLRNDYQGNPIYKEKKKSSCFGWCS